MQKITPHLWFDTKAKEAAEFYVSAFPDSKIDSARVIHGTPSGDCDILSFTLAGQSFMAISAGPYVKANPSISFFVNFDPSRDPEAKEHLDELWTKLSEDGNVLMPLQEYPFSKHYGWVEDKFGISWQLILTNPAGEPRPFIVPSIMFVGENAGKAEKATNMYMSIFKDTKRGALARYPGGMAPDAEGSLMFTDFMLENQWFAAMDSAHAHQFQLNEAISFIVHCDTQEEIDHYWQLSAKPESEQCGWLKDAYGLSWQIVPTAMDEMMKNGDEAAIQRVTQAFLQMKKFDLAKLQAAYKNSSS